MIPLHFPMWESDASVRASLEQSYAAQVDSPAAGSAMSGGQVGVDLEMRDVRTTYGASLSGAYARVVTPSLGDGDDPPPSDTVSGQVHARGAFTLSPRTNLSLSAFGYLASRLGVRAQDALAARDPFMGDRVQYTFGGDAGWSAIASRRWTFRVGGGYSQAGAISADRPEAEGIDEHAARAGVGASYELGPSDTLSPDVSYAYSHYYNALYDVYFTRGPADIHAGTALLTETHRFSRRLSGSIAGGATVATPLPILKSNALVVSPAGRLGADYAGRTWRAAASYAYEYTSLGPRIGYGHEHQGLVELAMRPKGGRRFRDLWITNVARLSYGSAPVAANPSLATGPEPPPPATGTLRTTTVAVGGRVEYPIARGIVALGGLDFQYIRADVDPPPPIGGVPAPSFQTIATVGIGGILSTDPRRRGSQRPGNDDDDAPVLPTEDPGARRAEIERAVLQAGAPPPPPSAPAP